MRIITFFQFCFLCLCGYVEQYIKASPEYTSCHYVRFEEYLSIASVISLHVCRLMVKGFLEDGRNIIPLWMLFITVMHD